MKNVTTTLLFVMLSVCQINAQNNGDFILGGSAGYGTNHFNLNTRNSNEILLIAPTVGSMLSERVAIGVDMAYANMDSQSDATGVLNGGVLALSPFIRIHKDIANNFKLYYGPHCGAMIDLDDQSNKRIEFYNVGFNVGLIYFITPKFSMEMNIAQLEILGIFDRNNQNSDPSLLFQYNLVDPMIGLKFYF